MFHVAMQPYGPRLRLIRVAQLVRRIRMNSAIRNRVLILILTVAALAISVFSQDATKKAPPKIAPANAAASSVSGSAGASGDIALPTIKYEKYTLSNGL